MAKHSLNDPLSNQKPLSPDVNLVALRDKLHDDLRQAAALIAVATGQGFLEFEQETLRHYLCSLQNVIVSILASYDRLDKLLDAR